MNSDMNFAHQDASIAKGLFMIFQKTNIWTLKQIKIKFNIMNSDLNSAHEVASNAQ